MKIKNGNKEITFLELVEKVLDEAKRPLNSEEIWDYAVEKGYDKLVGTKGKTPSNTIGALVYVNMRDKSNSLFAVTESRPKRFYLKSQTSMFDLTKEAQNFVPKKAEQTKLFKEKDLHPYVSYYAYHFLRCYTKTINHALSSKKEYGEWVHPDMVACHYSFEEWRIETHELSTSLCKNSNKLLSLELKRELQFGNLRESFFQAVSNSSWANEGYLVAAFISEDTEFREELSRLSTSFGIGIIQLNVEDPNATEIIIPARYKESLDWETIDKLTMNRDFKELITTIKIDTNSKKVHRKEYDPVLEIDQLKLI